MYPFVWNHIDQPRNPNYEKDIVYVTKHLKWILNSIGIWPLMLKNIGECLPKIAIVLSNLVVFFIEGLYILHIMLEQQDNFLRLRLMSFACYSLICLMKYWALIIRKPNIKYCVEQMYADWKQVSHDKYIWGTKWKSGANIRIYIGIYLSTNDIYSLKKLKYNRI